MTCLLVRLESKTLLSTHLSQGCWPCESIAVTRSNGIIVRTNIRTQNIFPTLVNRVSLFTTALFICKECLTRGADKDSESLQEKSWEVGGPFPPTVNMSPSLRNK
jgi:hypothetical protein